MLGRLREDAVSSLGTISGLSGTDPDTLAMLERLKRHSSGAVAADGDAVPGMSLDGSKSPVSGAAPSGLEEKLADAEKRLGERETELFELQKEKKRLEVRAPRAAGGWGLVVRCVAQHLTRHAITQSRAGGALCGEVKGLCH